MNNSDDQQVSDSMSVLYELKEKIATITINRPEKRNALSMQEFDSLIKLINKADNDSDVHVIRIRSTGDRAFSGGLDLNMLQQMSLEEVPKLVKYGEGLATTILKAKKPVVNQVQGPAVAWGTILCLAADFVIAGDNPKTFFSLPEIDLNLFPATGALSMALCKLGYRFAKSILMIPERISLEKAEQIGLVTKVCSLDTLEETTLEFCQNLANKPQSILIPIKILINNFNMKNLDSYLKFERDALNLALEGDLEKYNDFIVKIWKS